MEEFSGDNCSLPVANGWPKSGNTRTNGLNGTGDANVVTTGSAVNGPNSTRLESNDRLIPDSSSLENGLPRIGPSTSSSTEVVSSNGVAKTTTVATGSSELSDEDSEDDYCVYTYKGGNKESHHLADLPSSFYQFDSSDNQSEDLASHSGELGACLSSGNHLRFSDCNRRLHNSTGGSANLSNGSVNPAPNIFSPDMDFLEMDFDPSSYADTDGNDCASPDEDEVPNLVSESRHLNYGDAVVLPDTRRSDNPLMPLADEVPSSSSSCRNCPSTSSLSVVQNLNALVIEGNSKTSNEERKSDALNCDVRATPADRIGLYSTPTLGTIDDNVVTVTQRENQLSMRLVKSNTLPQLTSKPSDNFNTGGGNTFRASERSSALFSSEPLFHDSSEVHCSYRARINSPEETIEDSVELKVERVMIWDDAQAKEIAFSQISTSACGATALLNVLRALKMEALPDYVNACVGTRLREETADLPQYLFSRSHAGATHLDLISGIRRASNDLIYARFFRIKKNISFSAFNKWILHWICKGAIPVVTRNLQVGTFATSQDIPDSWHHQMVFGISPEGLYLNNPIECVPESILLPQITSDSVLLVRRHDIISRKGPNTDLRQLVRHADPRWNEMNVLGQVANILLEEIPYFSENTAARRVRSSHIKIPAQYQAGVTLFIRRESPACQQLMNTGEPN